MSAIDPADVDGISKLAQVIPQTQVGGYTEWSGWQAPAQATFERLGAQPWLARARGEAVTRGRANAR